jgi:pimeloyl-ACP methyl ester carboxylesterase
MQLWLAILLTGFVQLSQGATNAVEKQVQIGDHKLFVRTTAFATNSPTLVFESGGGGTSRDWFEIQKALSQRFNTLAYDRAGLGRSERGPEPRTLHQETFELHQLLEKEGISNRPHILVGHSLGGLLARIYTQQYGSNVAALVLVDPTHESAVLGSLRYGGWTRIREKATGRRIPEPRLYTNSAPAIDSEADYFAEELALMHRERTDETARFKQRPLVILGAGIRKAPPGTGDEQWRTLSAERNAQLHDLLTLSANSQFILARTNTHQLHIENPALIVTAIEQALKLSGK